MKTLRQVLIAMAVHLTTAVRALSGDYKLPVHSNDERLTVLRQMKVLDLI
jgi:hypothetical protein